MSTLKMVLHSEKTLKTSPRKSYQNLRNLQGKCLRLSCYSQTNFLWFTVILLMILKFETFGPVEHLWWSLFCENIQRVKVVGYFRRRAPTWMFDRILNATLLNNLL